MTRMRPTPSAEDIENIIGAFYSSATGEAPILDAVRLIQDSFKAASAQVFSMSSNENINFSETIVAHNPSTHAGVSDKVIEENWEGLEFGVDPRMAYSSTLPAGFIFHDHQFITDRQMDRHPFYQEFLRSFDLRYGVGANLEAATPTHQTLLSFNHSEAQGHISEDQIRAFGQIVPHAQRAVKMRWQLQREKSVNQSLMNLLEDHGTGIAFLDKQGNLLEMNATLEKVIAGRDGLTVVGRRLRPSSTSDQRAFERLLSDALDQFSKRSTNPRDTFIRRPSGKLSYIVNAVPVDSQRKLAQGGFCTTIERSVAVVLSIEDPALSGAPNVRLVRSYLGLTEKESLVACDLASGLTLDQTAVVRGITKQTARSHLRSIFSKTSTNRQSDLVRLISRLTG